jgi:tRNA uridine 5-carboxymethylaminomethyl modification enzyme
MRQGVNPKLIFKYLPDQVSSNISLPDLETTLADFLYRGYIESHRQSSERVNNYDDVKIPDNYYFKQVSGLSNEMVERLERANPQTFGQVRKIPGLTPAALSTVLLSITASKNKPV